MVHPENIESNQGKRKSVLSIPVLMVLASKVCWAGDEGNSASEPSSDLTVAVADEG